MRSEAIRRVFAESKASVTFVQRRAGIQKVVERDERQINEDK
jgi:hypothetical protein